MTTTNCPICNTPAFLYYHELFDDRFGCPGLFDLYSCNGCGHKYLQANFSDEQLSSLYNTFYPRDTFNIENVHPLKEITGLKGWLDGEKSFAHRWVPRNVSVLDVGCGSGKTLGYHKERGCEVFGVETDKNVQLVADKFGCSFHTGLFSPGNYQANFFDYITLDQVVEHFSQPVEAIKAVGSILKKNGVAVVCTPNPDSMWRNIFGRKWINWHTPYHLQLFSAESMLRLAEMAGFKLEKCITKTSSIWVYYQLCSLICFPLPGVPSQFWSPHGAVRSPKQRLLIKIVELLHSVKITHLMSRIFDAMQMGDNHIFLLRKK